MSRGGARRGAGRPLGSRNRKTGEVAEMARTLGITPLEVMVEHMRTCYEAGDMVAAHEAAKDCAPYMHPRLNSIDARVDQHTTHEFVEDYRRRLVAEIDRIEEIEFGAEDSAVQRPDGRATH